ncbi:type II toxin-antitoxin system VapC family toxin [Sulfuricystis multivorans]|uniref:type II toxin-antitoxin system VapC family toxin n=1 Tax=Sulfuricystis multivorans TaxID=2211108 RepID=UPI000F81A9F7|nr:type II toxin-antitoxin system VapC family toxin [Sulfuricystis multivorans]
MFLLDTNVVSELRKVRMGKANPGLATWADGVETDRLFISVLSIEELEIGVLRAERRDPAQGAILRVWLDQHVLPAFAERILPVDLAVARLAARVHVPDPRPAFDALIAATALANDFTLVTRNETDFLGMGVRVLNPWT